MARSQRSQRRKTWLQLVKRKKKVLKSSISIYHVATWVFETSPTPILHSDVDDFHDSVAGRPRAYNLFDWTEMDRPETSVYLINFEDATLLTIL